MQKELNHCSNQVGIPAAGIAAPGLLVIGSDCLHSWAIHLKSIVLLILALFVSACATLDRNECETGNWQEIGYHDGARGRGGEFLDLHRKACTKHGVTVEEPVYQGGYKAGLADFCLPETGYRLGRNEELYNYVCPVEFERDFVVAYASGATETMAELKLAENFLENRLWYATVRHRHYESSHEVATAVGTGSDRTIVLREPHVLDSLRHQLDNYRDRRARLRGALAKAERFLKSVAARPTSVESSGNETSVDESTSAGSSSDEAPSLMSVESEPTNESG